jgi:hypothetical protein
VHLAYCGFACQGCDHTKVSMDAISNDLPSGGDDGEVPSWWLGTMHMKLEMIRAKGAVT